ncbi:MAG: Zn-ribbon domain-containing OB-fold protein [Bradyrhizobium sp.]
MSGGGRIADWTKGEAAIVYQTCRSCGARQYFRRAFCAACGGTVLDEAVASGEGTVYATSLVCRAATSEARAHVPYNIVLIDAVEGFRMMAHGHADLAIGDAVTARFVPFAGRFVPCFAKASPRDKTERWR